MKTIFKKWLDEVKEAVKSIEQKERESAKRFAKSWMSDFAKMRSGNTYNQNYSDFEPKLNYRFKVEFPQELEIPKYSVISIDKPKFVTGTNDHTQGIWQPMEIIFVDLIGPSTSDALYKLKNGGLKSLSIISLDPTGVEIEEWKIDIDYIMSIDFGNLDYGSNKIQKITMIISPSNCTLV